MVFYIFDSGIFGMIMASLSPLCLRYVPIAPSWSITFIKNPDKVAIPEFSYSQEPFLIYLSGTDTLTGQQVDRLFPQDVYWDDKKEYPNNYLKNYKTLSLDSHNCGFFAAFAVLEAWTWKDCTKHHIWFKYYEINFFKR